VAAAQITAADLPFDDAHVEDAELTRPPAHITVSA
jgi:hypothetical protein